MPELPEVECLTRAVRLATKGCLLVEAIFLRADLRDPIPIDEFRRILVGQRIEDVYRRSKYMLMQTSRGLGVFHLGMTGNMIQRPTATPDVPHTHAVFTIKDVRGREKFLHFIDPRRFGRIACLDGSAIGEHALFADLGPEPLETRDLGAHLFSVSRGKKAPVKCFVMDARMVVGVGNIYASESLHRAGINPKTRAGSISAARYALLGEEIKATLRKAIEAGGTTFRDFKNTDGNPGYFAVELTVYDREGEPCRSCGKAVKQIRQAGRSTFYCAFCQT